MEKILALLRNKKTGISLLCVIFLVLIGLWFIVPLAVKKALEAQDIASRSVISVSLTPEERKSLEKEVGDLKNAIRSSNKNGGANYAKQYRTLATTYERLGYIGKAVEAYDRALSEEPHHAETLLLKGSVLWTMREFTKAEKTYREVIDQNPTDQTAYVKLAGMYLYGLNDSITARGIYMEGLTRSNNDLNLMRSFATFLEVIGRPEEAYLYWDVVLKRFPTDASAKARLDALKAYNPTLLHERIKQGIPQR